MSTIIKSRASTGRTVEIGMGVNGPWVEMADSIGETSLINVTRADFLAAVATECNVRIVPATEPLADWELELMGRKTVPADAIVIERGELPEVEERTPGYFNTGDVQGFGGDESREWYREQARNYLAMSEYVATHPPVDEAQVRAIALTLTNSHTMQGERETSIDYARRLYLAGVRIVEDEDK